MNINVPFINKVIFHFFLLDKNMTVFVKYQSSILKYLRFYKAEGLKVTLLYVKKTTLARKIKRNKTKKYTMNYKKTFLYVVWSKHDHSLLIMLTRKMREIWYVLMKRKHSG